MPQKTVDESALKAAARAYALSSSSNNNNKKKASTTTTTNPSYQTPPIKPTPPHPVRQTRAKGSSSSSSSTSITSNSALKKSPPFSARRKLGDAPQPPPPQTNHDNDDNDIDNDDDIEYNLFVRKLMDDNWGNVRNYLNNDDDDDDDYNIPTTKDGDDDDDEYDDDDEEFFQQLLSSSSSIHDDDLGDTSVLSTPQKPLPLNQQQQQEPCSGVGLDPHVSLQQHHGMEAELGGLLEEELEAAVSTLLGNPASPPPPDHQTMTTATTPRTPASSSDQIQRHAISPTQSNRLVRLLQGHYQLLIQQALVAVRKAHLSRKAVHNNHQHQQGVVGDEKAEDLAEILDGAVGMLQDLDHQRKDAIRTLIQLPPPQTAAAASSSSSSARRILLDDATAAAPPRLTRAAFTKTLLQKKQQPYSTTTFFAIRGLENLDQTFCTMDGATHSTAATTTSNQNAPNILDMASHGQACRWVLREAGAHVEESFLPGVQDFAELVSSPKEVFGLDFEPPCNDEFQRRKLLKDRNQFTAAEDSLVFRGVNLYGEKQWMLIADRFLPDRSVNIISQRYSKLCLLLYRAHGIQFDKDGVLPTPPKHDSIDQVDETKLAALKRVDPPAILNVHRWSIEEDLTLLKAVPILGHMWAEVSSRLIPHRDRGHLRKRYQVLERRIKATVNREQRAEGASKRAANRQQQQKQQQQVSAGKQMPNMMISKRPKALSNNNNNNNNNNVLRGPAPGHLLRPSGRLLQTKPTGRKLPLKRRATTTTMVEMDIAPPPANLPRVNSTELDNVGAASNAASINQQGIETILNETGEWSQMSKLKKLMADEDDDDDAANRPKQSSLDDGGSRSGIERLPQLDIDTTSGLSLLTKMDGAFASPAKRRPRGSILDTVLKGGGGGSEEAPPTTPSKPPGTPNGLAFSPAAHRIHFSPRGFSPATTPRGGYKNTFSSPNFKTGLSPSGNSNRSFLLHVVNSTDGYEFCNFDISDRSRQAFEGKVPLTPNRPAPREQQDDDSSMPPPPSTPSRSLFAEVPSSLMPTDTQAALALNSMSNSPARLLRKRDAPPILEDGASSDSVQRTLFENVVKLPRKKRKT